MANVTPEGPESDLIEFYGTECGICHQMEPLVQRVCRELNLTVQKYEVWHNAANMEFAQKMMSGKASSIPFFYNKKTGDYIVGRADYARFKQWASGKK